MAKFPKSSAFYSATDVPFTSKRKRQKLFGVLIQFGHLVVQFQNAHAGFTIFSVHSQHLKSSSSAFRPALSNLWLLLV